MLLSPFNIGAKYQVLPSPVGAGCRGATPVLGFPQVEEVALWGVGLRVEIAPTTSRVKAPPFQGACALRGQNPLSTPPSLHPTPYPPHPVQQIAVKLQKLRSHHP